MSVPTRRVREELISAADMTEDEYYRLLSDERRRIVLQALTELERPLTLGEVAEEVSARENDGESAPPSRDVRADLHHCHLPLLDDFGIVEYDWQTNRIE